MIQIIQASSDAEIAAVRELLTEYINWTATFLQHKLEDVPTFKGIGDEFATLPGIYTPPAGRLLLALLDDRPVGCVALKQISSTVCELKRLYVRPDARGANIGSALVKALVEQAIQAGYSKMILDSHITMKSAHQIYQGVGFKIVDGPADFPEALRPVVVFMELDLTAPNST
jgi:GNAT superfamily N-acetyltransferase